MGDPRVFAQELWAKNPVYREGADPRGYEDLLSLDDVDLIVSFTGPRLPAFRLVKEGETIPSSRYTKTTRTGSQSATGVMDSRAVFAEFAEGATIVFQGMHRYWGPLAVYCRHLEQALGHPVQANAYVTPPGAQGFRAHEDEHDVFVLQSHGTKEWLVYDRHDLPPTHPPLIDAGLAPGDSLYIPQGFPHAARTQSVASVHITVGILTITWGALPRETLKMVESNPSFKEPLPLRFAEEGGGFEKEVRDRLTQVAAMMDGLDAADLARRVRRSHLTSRQPLLRGQIHRLLKIDEVSDHSTVRRRDEAICLLEKVGGELSVLLGDRELRMPEWVEPGMAVIAGGEKVLVADLPGLDEESRSVLTRRLIREG